MTNLNLQSVLLLVEVKSLNRETVSSVMQHLLGNIDNETIRMHRSRAIANPRCALNIYATLRIGSTLGQEIVYPKSA